MDVRALLATGIPPIGLGLYVHTSRVDPSGMFRFRVVNGTRADHESLVRAARELGDVWLYGGPRAFAPSEWREWLRIIAQRARALDCTGILADPENGWNTLDGATRARELVAMGRELGALAGDMRVGVTSYPHFPIERVAEGAGESIFGSIQIYGRETVDAGAFGQWFARWRAVFGARLGLSIAGWPASSSMRDAPGFARYLAALPRAPSAIVWDSDSDIGSQPHIATALAGYSPGGSDAGTALLALETILARPAGLAVVGALAALVVAVAVAWKGVA